MKRVIAGTTPEGRSYVESIEELPVGEPITVFEGLVNFDGVVLPANPDDAIAWLEPPAGGAKWRFAVLPPSKDDTRDLPGLMRGKLHTTRTIDFTYLVEGELLLELDESSVELQAGDFVILKAANHAWHNNSTKDVKLLALLNNPGA